MSLVRKAIGVVVLALAASLTSSADAGELECWGCDSYPVWQPEFPFFYMYHYCINMPYGPVGYVACFGPMLPELECSLYGDPRPCGMARASLTVENIALDGSLVRPAASRVEAAYLDRRLSYLLASATPDDSGRIVVTDCHGVIFARSFTATAARMLREDVATISFNE